MAKKETTTITVWKDTVKELNKLKIHPRQIMAELIDELAKKGRSK